MRLLPLFLVFSSARACFFTEETLNKKEGENKFEVKREDSSVTAIHEGSQDSVLDEANVDKCSRTWCVQKNGTCIFGDDLNGRVKFESNEVMILDCYCMTAEVTDNKTVVYRALLF